MANPKVRTSDRAEYKHQWYLKNKTKIRKRQKKYYERLKQQAIQEYGGKCAICGSTENLEFDHINGYGTLHRKLEPLSRLIYLYLRKREFPKNEYRLLCRQCNTDEYWKKRRRF